MKSALQGHELDLQTLAVMTEGYSGSDLVRGVNEAKRKLFRRLVEARKAIKPAKSKDVTFRDLEEALKVTRPLKDGKGWEKDFDSWVKRSRGHGMDIVHVDGRVKEE